MSLISNVWHAGNKYEVHIDYIDAEITVMLKIGKKSTGVGKNFLEPCKFLKITLIFMKTSLEFLI
jgi:hypothetical protein